MEDRGPRLTIAVPLGLTARRTDTSRGLIISLAIGAGYFLTTVMADMK